MKMIEIQYNLGGLKRRSTGCDVFPFGHNCSGRSHGDPGRTPSIPC